MNDLASDLAWFFIIVDGDGEWRSVCRSFNRSGDFWGWSRRRCLSGRVDEGGGRGGELVGEDVGGDGRHVVGEM